MLLLWPWLQPQDPQQPCKSARASTATHLCTSDKREPNKLHVKRILLLQRRDMRDVNHEPSFTQQFLQSSISGLVMVGFLLQALQVNQNLN